MSSWGNLDNVTVTGTVTISTSSNTVSGAGTVFTGNVNAGDYVTIEGQKYQVEQVVNATTLYLTSNAGTSGSSFPIEVQQGPKYISNVAISENVYSIQTVYGIDKVEIAVPENQARGVASHTGWIDYKTYTTTQGATRNKSEVLVAMSKNFNANATFVLQTDGADDTVAADYSIGIDTQPVNTTETAGDPIVFFTVASTTPAGQSVSYQWYEDNTVGIAAITDGGDYSGATTNTLTIANVSNVDGFSYYVVVSGAGGADSVTSDTATATAD